MQKKEFIQGEHRKMNTSPHSSSSFSSSSSSSSSPSRFAVEHGNFHDESSSLHSYDPSEWGSVDDVVFDSRERKSRPQLLDARFHIAPRKYVGNASAASSALKSPYKSYGIIGGSSSGAYLPQRPASTAPVISSVATTGDDSLFALAAAAENAPRASSLTVLVKQSFNNHRHGHNIPAPRRRRIRSRTDRLSSSSEASNEE